MTVITSLRNTVNVPIWLLRLTWVTIVIFLFGSILSLILGREAAASLNAAAGVAFLVSLSSLKQHNINRELAQEICRLKEQLDRN